MEEDRGGPFRRCHEGSKESYLCMTNDNNEPLLNGIKRVSPKVQIGTSSDSEKLGRERRKRVLVNSESSLSD